MNRSLVPILLALLLCALSCSSDNGSPSDPDGGGDDSAVTVISMANKSSWTFQENGTTRPYSYWDNGTFRCSVDIYGTPPNCSSLNRSYSALSANRINFTQFKECRVQFRAHARTIHYSWTGGALARVSMVIRSNTPRAPDLEVMEQVLHSEYQQVSELDETFDISLANALGFSEATVSVYLQTTLNEPGTAPCQSESLIEVSGFKIVGKR